MTDSAARPKVLLVDDEPFTLTAVGGVLRGGGFDVLTCEMWAGAANMVRTERPDLVLLDYNMRSLKGDNICIILKRNIQDAAMKIVLFSSEAEHELAKIADQCGADGYIRKDTPGPARLARVASYVGAVATTEWTPAQAPHMRRTPWRLPRGAVCCGSVSSVASTRRPCGRAAERSMHRAGPCPARGSRPPR